MGRFNTGSRVTLIDDEFTFDEDTGDKVEPFTVGDLGTVMGDASEGEGMWGHTPVMMYVQMDGHTKSSIAAEDAGMPDGTFIMFVEDFQQAYAH